MRQLQSNVILRFNASNIIVKNEKTRNDKVAKTVEILT